MRRLTRRQSEQSPLLPDGFRRSPKGKQRARLTANDHVQQEHQPGAIVRITMRNFVTYTNATFHPGPNLNMIIGPNGTGKSTLVCGICLGLGWKPEHLGRAKDVSEFVKHGCKEAIIEIELKADPQRQQTNPIIGCRISRDGGGKNNQDKKTAFKINGKTVSNKAVQEFCRSFSIQVDNLCQFLPQDRVADFAALSPVDLLVQTQRAAGGEQMSQYHEDLKKWRREEKALLNDQQNLFEELKRLEDRQRAQEMDVERMRERELVQEKLELLKRFRPCTEFNELKRKHEEARAREREAKEEKRRVEDQIEPNMRAVAAKETYVAAVKRAVESKKRMVQRSVETVAHVASRFKELEEAVAGCDAETKAETVNAAKAKQDVAKLQQAIRTIENAMASPPAEFNAVEMNEKTTQLGREIRTLEDELNRGHETVGELREQARQRQQIIAQEEEKQTHLQSQAGRLESKLSGVSRASADVWRWVQANKDKFEHEVFGPPMIVCAVKGGRDADWIEAMVGAGELKAFTVCSRNDFNVLTHQAYQVMGLTDVNIRNSTLGLDQYPTPDTSPEEMKRLGLDGWLMELITGPEPVLAMLCDNTNLHRNAFCKRDITEDQYDMLKKTSISSWCTPTNTYRMIRRGEYGEAGTAARVSPLHRARLLTDAPVSTQAEEDSKARIATLEGEISHIKEEMHGVRARAAQLKEKITKLKDEVESIKKEKAHLQQQKSQYDGLPTKLASNKARLADLQAQLAEQDARKWEIAQRQMRLIFEQGQQALDHGTAVRNLRDFQEELLRAEINGIEAASDLAQVTARNQADKDLLTTKENDLRVAIQKEREARRLGKAKSEAVHQLVAEMRNGDLTPLEDEIHELIKDWEPPALDTEIASVEASLELLAGTGNANLVREFEARAKKIEERRAQRKTLGDDLEALTTKIAQIRELWEPQLDELVRKISDAFSENFTFISCAGEVGIDKQEDFADWAIQIKVKFRYAVMHTKSLIGSQRTKRY